MPIQPFSPPFSQAAVDDLHDRLARTRWIDEIRGSGWQYGFNLDFLKDLCRYWREEFDWNAQVERVSSFHHYRFTYEGIGIHFIHEHGKGKSPLPIIVTHGWPGSFLEMLQLIPMLTDPATFGADAPDSFDVIVPSLPGYGYSDHPTQPGMNVWRIADIWVALMRELARVYRARSI
jgi:hypothetical protein